jgi:hypothetical protein
MMQGKGRKGREGKGREGKGDASSSFSWTLKEMSPFFIFSLLALASVAIPLADGKIDTDRKTDGCVRCGKGERKKERRERVFPYADSSQTSY